MPTPPRHRPVPVLSLESEVASLRTAVQAQQGAVDETRVNVRDVHRDIREILAKASTLATSEQVSALDARLRTMEAHNAKMQPEVESIPQIREHVRLMREELTRKADQSTLENRLKPLEESRTVNAAAMAVIRWVGPTGLATLFGALFWWFSK